MCTSMSYWEWKLLHGTAPQPTGWLQKPTFNAWDFDSRDWPLVHFSAEVPLWTQSYWNGELFMIMKSIVFILFYSIFQYWGWCKYRYRESDKKTFQDAKNSTLLYLNACPAEVIRRFINRSWHFMCAYRLGLTGRAAEWAVCKQKQHRSVSRAAMMALESILVH